MDVNLPLDEGTVDALLRRCVIAHRRACPLALRALHRGGHPLRALAAITGARTSSSRGMSVEASACMFAPKHILVPVAVAAPEDVSDATALVDAALDVARTSDATVTLAYVEPIAVPAMPLDIGMMPANALAATAQVREANTAAARDSLQALLERAKAAGVNADARVAQATGSVGDTIAKLAVEAKCDLVVVNSHGRKGMRRLLLGSVAERVAHVSTVPVLLLRT